jgi:acetyltransferase-like isoleucine patch superfamily enzyme
VGDRIYFKDSVSVEPYVGFLGGGRVLCNIGAFSYSNSPLHADLNIGRYCSIAWALSFQGPRHPYEFISTSNFTYDSMSPVIRSFIHNHEINYRNFPTIPTRKNIPNIENDVWIGQGVLLNDGITIGTGAIVASNSVVTKDVRSYEIVGGNPARVIKKRFNDEIIAGLLETEWWKYKFTDFNELAIHEPSRFIKEFMAKKNDLIEYLPKRINLIDIP